MKKYNTRLFTATECGLCNGHVIWMLVKNDSS